MTSRQLVLDIHEKLIVDLFAGGGGMSLAFERAFGRSPDIAVNHDDDALSMHRMNHPQTRHFAADVFEVCPRAVTQGRPVGWLHGSPDCRHHSQAAGGQPRSKKIRGLGWVLPRWAGQVRPDVISMENVKQMLKWGPLVAKRDPVTGRCLKRVADARGKWAWVPAAPGERVPVQDQYLVPDKRREGQTWRRFVATFVALGYQCDYRIRIAANAGGHTTRTRLFFIARRDGQPIVFPEPKYFQKADKGEKRWKAAAECIDFSIPCRSIFDRPRPLAEATLKRIATGIRKFVLENPRPFIVPLTHQGGEGRVHSVDDPLRTITAAHRGEFAVAAPVLAGVGGRAGQSEPKPASEPLNTITAKADTALVFPVLIQAAHGEGSPDGVKRWGAGCRDVGQPVGTITASGGHAIAASYLMQANGGFCTTPGHDAREPVSTVTNSGSQQQVITALLEKYDAPHGYDSGSDSSRTFRDSPGRDDLAAQATGRLGKSALGEAAASGTQDAERLSRDQDGREPEAVLGVCAQADLDDSARANSGRAADQPHRRGQDEQSAVKPRAGHAFGKYPARVRYGFEGPSSGHSGSEVAPGQGFGEGATRDGDAVLCDCEGIGGLADAGIQGSALRVAAFLTTYYGTGQPVDLRDPAATVTTKDRMALVTVTIKGTPYVIVDIGLRMLEPRELYRAQDFPDSYIIDRGHDGRLFSKSTQVRMVGNSVNPVDAADFIDANAPWLAVRGAA